MSHRFDYKHANMDAFHAMVQFERFNQQVTIEKPIVELVKLRASQINGCAFCLDMHYRCARELGESERRLSVLAAWRDSGMFSDREQAALALTEVVTRIENAGVPDNVYETVRRQFSEFEYMELITIINVINCWNRISIATGLEPPEGQ